MISSRFMINLTSLGADQDYFAKKEASKTSMLKAINDKTFNPMVISEDDKNTLINLCKQRG